MSRETRTWLNRNILRGFTDKRGYAWHYSADDQGDEPNHYPGAIPVEDLYRRLFGWAAIPKALYMDNGDMGITKIDGQVAWVRNDTNEVLGIHSDSYSGHQYAQWCVKNVESILGQGADVANAGLLKNGAVAWVQVEMPENVEMAAGVQVRPFLLATTSFDGSIATTYKLGYTDVVCDNTRELFLREAGETFRLKHTSKSSLKIMEAREALGLMFKMSDAIAAEVDELVNIDVNDRQWSKFLEAHAPIADDASKRATTIAENKREELTRMWNTDVRVSPWRGTAWGVVQAVNTYTAHVQTVRNTTNRVERNMLNAVKAGQIAGQDKATLVTLQGVLGRELVAV